MSQDYANYIIDMLGDWGSVRAKSMFGGFGLYRGEQIFALIAHDTLYFKVGARNKADYEDEGMEPFTYETKKGTRAAMSYFEVPPDVLEDAEKLGMWAQKAYEEGLAAQK